MWLTHDPMKDVRYRTFLYRLIALRWITHKPATDAVTPMAAARLVMVRLEGITCEPRIPPRDDRESAICLARESTQMLQEVPRLPIRESSYRLPAGSRRRGGLVPIPRWQVSPTSDWGGEQRRNHITLMH